MSTHVVIPVRDRVALTASICDQLAGQAGWDRCWVYDNGSQDGTRAHLLHLRDIDPRFCPIPAAGDPIYRMWDRGFRQAKTYGATRVLFLNNDVILAPGTVEALNVALDSDPDLWLVYPDYDADPDREPWVTGMRDTSGTYRHGGMCGWAFMLRAGPVDWSPLIDPALVWWGGDDDLAFEIEHRGGRQARVVGLPVVHLGSQTAALHPQGSCEADLAYVVAKWGR